MKQENQLERKKQIESAAYLVLKEKGYKATSMLAIAKKAGASNETLYKWYGNKQVLFKSLVEENTREIKAVLQKSLAKHRDAKTTLADISVKLLTMVTGEKAIILNRAAASDVYESNELGKVIAVNGRGVIAPLMTELFQQAREQGLLNFDSVQEVVEIYISLLIGDWQIQGVINAKKRPSKSMIQQRAQLAIDSIMKLYAQ